MQQEREMPPLTGSALGKEILRRLARRAGRRLRRPSTWLYGVVAAAGLTLLAALPLAHPVAAVATVHDGADRYVRALQTGDVDVFLASLSPEARAGLVLATRQSLGPPPDGERRGAELVLRADHVDRATRLGQYQTAEGSFVVYAAERNTPAGTQSYPLIVWLDREGRVVRAMP